MNLEMIRSGNSTEAHIPRSQFRKLWNWCLAHSEIGGVNVRVYRSSDYGVKCDRVMKRMGRAIPTLRVRSRFDFRTEKNVIGHTDISWSYVY